MQSAYDRISLYKFSQKEKEELIKKIKKFMDRNKRIKLAIIFGSLITRDHVKDIDVCVSSEPKLSFIELLDLNARMELELGIPIDLVELGDLPKLFKQAYLRMDW